MNYDEQILSVLERIDDSLKNLYNMIKNVLPEDLTDNTEDEYE